MTTLSWMDSLDLTKTDNIEKTVYAVHVSFYQYEGWSRTYAYKSYVPYKKDAIVLVEKRQWYNIGKVVRIEENFEFNPKIDYKFVIKEIQL